MYRIGLTGGIGSGKSSVAEWFKTKKIPLLDADQIVHNLLDQDPETIQLLTIEFGEEIRHNDCIDRKALGRIVFADSTAREKLENIVHPRVYSKMLLEQKKFEDAGAKVCVWDIPLLLESKSDMVFQEIWVVWVPEEIQLHRVQLRDKLLVEDVKRRIHAQMPLFEKRCYADVIIDNSGDWAATLQQLENEWSRLKRILSSLET